MNIQDKYSIINNAVLSVPKKGWETTENRLAIIILRERKHSYKEISEFFFKNGYSFSQSAIRDYMIRNPASEEELQEAKNILRVNTSNSASERLQPNLQTNKNHNFPETKESIIPDTVPVQTKDKPESNLQSGSQKKQESNETTETKRPNRKKSFEERLEETRQLSQMLKDKSENHGISNIDSSKILQANENIPPLSSKDSVPLSIPKTESKPVNNAPEPKEPVLTEEEKKKAEKEKAIYLVAGMRVHDQLLKLLCTDDIDILTAGLENPVLHTVVYENVIPIQFLIMLSEMVLDNLLNKKKDIIYMHKIGKALLINKNLPKDYRKKLEPIIKY